MTRKQLLEGLDTYELQEWMAFYQLEGGFGDIKQDFRIGQLVSVLANVNRNSKKRPTPFKTEDFALRPKPAAKKQDLEARVRATFDALAALPGKKKKGQQHGK